MTNETKSRIRAYTEALPHMKEKVFVALFMLVVAACIVVTATYAWITLSRAPEVSNITTTLSANGALEIALAKPDGSLPSEFDVDENAAIGTNLTESNLQWGNLVNLSDKSYGIDNVALRPAQLRKESLATNPLWGAIYGEDGRITALEYESFAYTKFNGTQFLTSKDLGVRAIATYKTEISTETQGAYDALEDAVNTAHNEVNKAYTEVAPKFSFLGEVVNVYANDKLNETNSDLGGYIEDVIPLYEAVFAAMEKQKVAYVALANLQNYLISNEAGIAYKALTWDDLAANRAKYSTDAVVERAEGDPLVISLVGLSEFIEDYILIQDDIKYLKQYAEDVAYNGAAYYWGGSHTDANGNVVPDNSVPGFKLNEIVADLVDHSKMRIDLSKEGKYENSVLVVGLNSSHATSLLGANGQSRTVFIVSGILHRLEKIAVDPDFRINGKAEIKLNVIVSIYGKATCYFEGEEKNYSAFSKNILETTGVTLAPNDAVAEDTYALAVDLWVRTNAEQTCLILEGAIVSDPEKGDYQYQGDNRIWGEVDGVSLTTNSTTQGGGSCYTYYADTPEDMMRSLELLKTMKVVFSENYLDADGKVIKSNPLATAEMDTENYLAVNGYVTVPLVLSSDTTTSYTFVDDTNTVRTGRAITTLYTDLPVCITAIVYLDGSQLSNDHVLAAAQIQGSLNIQFGSSTNLETVGDSDLKNAERYITATVSPNELNYDTYETEEEITSTVTLNITGTKPTAVTAFFVRAINSTQGSREEPMEFRALTDGTWVSKYRFTAPGTYYLRQVCLDGVNYTLETPQKAEVSGYGLKSVTWSESSNNVAVRTSTDSHTTRVTVKFASSDASKLPVSVQARFVRDGSNAVNVPLTYNANGEWAGSATFTVSGVYTLQYLVADGKYVDIPLSDGSYRTLDLSLGMYVTVESASGALREDFTEGETYPRTVKVKVFNNAGAQLPELENMILFYSNGGSATDTIDATLVWDELVSAYTGTLFIREPGQFQFAYVTLGGNYLSECRENPPVYVLRSDKPVIYNTDSACTFCEGIQYAPVTKDATIDGIRIRNATSVVEGTAEVYSEEANEFYTVDLVYTGSYYSQDGKVAGGEFYVKLPTYEKNVGTEAAPVYEQWQDGKWSIAAISLWNCYDENGVERGENSKIVWVDNGTLGEQYLSTPKAPAKADRNHDFSALTTTVSAEVIVTMGHTIPMNGEKSIELGSKTHDFGTIFYPSQTGMSITVTDGNEKPIPKDIDITMTVKYSGNKDAATYGYEVNASATYTIKLNDVSDTEAGAYTVSSMSASGITGDIKDNWKYVGVYTVESLVVTIGGKEYTGTISDVPKQYTVKTAAPTADSIRLDSAVLGATVFGTDELQPDLVTGTFLQAYKPKTTVRLTVPAKNSDVETMNSAVIANMSVALELEYLGDSEKYGWYEIDGTTGYENLSYTLKKNDTDAGKYEVYLAQTMLAGQYNPTVVKVTVGGSTVTTQLSQLLSNADQNKVFEVYSMKPDVKVTGVSTMIEGKENDPVTVNKNVDKNTSHLTANAEGFTATNRYDEPDGRWAVVYMAYTVGAAGVTHEEAGCEEKTSTGEGYDDYLDYTQPGVQFTMFNGGTGTAKITVDGIGVGTVELKNNTGSGFVPIGSITTDIAANIDKHSYGFLGLQNCWRSYTTEKANLLSDNLVTIEEVTSTVGNATITRQLANPITISQPNQANPTLTWDTTGVTIAVTHGNSTYNGTKDIPAMAVLKATVTAEFGYHHPVLEKPDGAIDWEKVSGDEYTAVYTFKMPFENAKLVGTAQKHSTITFSSTDTATVSMKATVEGETETVTSGVTGVKAGGLVTVTVERKGNNCKPILTAPSNAINWQKVDSKSDDFTTVYTFTMPGEPVTLAAPTTTAMYHLTWDTTLTTMTVTAKDENGEFSGDSYGVPGQKVTVELKATGGTQPRLTKHDDMENWTPTENYLDATYTFTYNIPGGSLELNLSAQGFPVLKLDKTCVEITVYSGTEDVTEKYNNGGIGIQPGSEVTVTLKAKAGYYNPQMTLDGVSWSEDPDEGMSESTYKFIMSGADVSSTVSAAGYTVTYNANGGSCITASQTYAGTALTLPTPTRTGHTFIGWYTAASGGTKVEDDYMPSANVTLYAQWTVNSYTITVSTNNATVMVNGAAVANNGTKSILYGAQVTVTVTYSENNNQSTTIKGDDGTTYTSPFNMPAQNVTVSATSSGCVTPDTLVTLANGTQVRVDSLTGDEELLVWNMETGTLDSAPILFVDNDPEADFEVIHLFFSDGTDVKVIYEHGFWDYDLNKYVYLDRYADKYIGHTFAKQNGDELEQVELVDVVIKTEVTTAWSPVTADHLCYFVNGMLSMPGGVGGLFNIFDVNPDTMAYDYVAIESDIATYGLFTYEELNAICPLSEDMFNMAGGAYLKISIGKGNLTMDELIYMITRYSKFFD